MNKGRDAAQLKSQNKALLSDTNLRKGGSTQSALLFLQIATFFSSIPSFQRNSLSILHIYHSLSTLSITPNAEFFMYSSLTF